MKSPAVLVPGKAEAGGEIATRPFQFATEHIGETVRRQRRAGVLEIERPLRSRLILRVRCHALRRNPCGQGFDSSPLYTDSGLVVGATVFTLSTPLGVMKLPEHARIPIKRKYVVDGDADGIVGKPNALIRRSVCSLSDHDAIDAG